MAELNSDIPLAGVTTTHPTLAISPQENALMGAQTAGAQAGAQLTQQQIQAASLENQLKQQQLGFNQATASAYGSTSQAIKQKYAQPTAAAPTMGAAGGDVSAAGGTPTTVDPTAPATAAQAGVHPAAYDAATQNGWNVDKAKDWYTDKDGNPVSMYTGPAITPSGRVNTHSAEFQDALADNLQARGAPVNLIVQQRMAAEASSRALDKDMGDLYEKSASAEKSKAQAAKDAVDTQQAGKNLFANQMDLALKDPNPTAAVRNLMYSMPGMSAQILTQMGADPQQLAGPNAHAYIDQFVNTHQDQLMKVAQGVQSQSPNYQKQQEIEQNQWKVVTGVDIAGNPTTQLVKPPSGAQGARVISTGVTPAGYLGAEAIKNAEQSVIEGRSPAPTITSRSQADVQLYNALQRDYPGVDFNNLGTIPTVEKSFSAAGVNGAALRNYSAAYDHADVVRQLAAYAKPDGSLLDAPIVNGLKNRLMTGTGVTSINNLADAIDIYATEQAKAITGAGNAAPTEGAIAEQRAHLNAALGKGQIGGVLDTNQALALEKMNEYKNSYVNTFNMTPNSKAAASARFDQMIPTLAPKLNSSMTISGQPITSTAAGNKTTTGTIFSLDQAKAYAKANNISLDEAQRYLISKGGTPRG